MLQKMGHFSPRVAFKMRYRQKCQIFQDFPKFWEDQGQSICLQKWPLSIANRGSKLAEFRENHALRARPEMFPKWAILDLGYRSKCGLVRNVKFATIFQNLGGIVVNPLVSKKWPLSMANRGSKLGNVGRNRVLRRRPRMLQKRGHFFRC